MAPAVFMRRLGALFVPAVLIGVACAASTVPGAPAPGKAPSSAPVAVPGSEARSEVASAVTGEGRANGPASPAFGQLNPTGPKDFDRTEFVQLLRRDVIRPVYSPEYRTARQVALDPEDLVIGVSLAGEHRAYPVKTLEFSEMVNDVLGGSPILVSW